MKRTIQIVAAALVATSLGMGVALAADPAPQVNATVASPLPVVTYKNLSDEVLTGDKPVIVVVVSGKSCSALESLVEKFAQSNPQAKFVKAESEHFGVPDDKLPILTVFAPGASRSAVFEKVNFSADETTIDAFLTARIEASAKMIAAQNAIDAAQPEITLLLDRVQQLYANPKDEEKQERIDTTEKLSALFKGQAQNHKLIADTLRAEREASK